MRARSCFSRPFLSTACWAMTSPVPKRMAVVTTWVSRGRLTSLAWYLLSDSVSICVCVCHEAEREGEALTI